MTVRHSGPAAAMSDTLTMIGRSIRLTRRNPETTIMSIVLPLVLMTLFVLVFGGAIDTGTSGMIDRLRSLPVRSFAVLNGHVTASVARNAVATTVVVIAAVLMGFRPTATPLDWLLVAGLLLLYVLAVSWIAAGLGVLARSVESAGVLGFAMLFLPYLSSAFVPLSTMPAPLRAVSEHQPITPIIETLRGLLTGTPVGATGWAALAWCVGLLAASIVFATAVFVRRQRT